MKVPKIRLNWIWRIILMGALLCVFIFFAVTDKWAESSIFIQVRTTVIIGIVLFIMFAVSGTAIMYHKSTIVLHRDGKFTHAGVALDMIEVPYKRGGRGALLPFWLIKHDGFNAYSFNPAGRGERGGIECVPHVPDKKNSKYGAMVQKMGDSYIIHSKDRKAHIGVEAHNKLGAIWDEIIQHGNTKGCRYNDDTIVYMHTIPGQMVVVPEEVLERLMDLTEANVIHGIVQAQERMTSTRLQEEIESRNIRGGAVKLGKNVDDVRDPNSETE